MFWVVAFLNQCLVEVCGLSLPFNIFLYYEFFISKFYLLPAVILRIANRSSFPPAVSLKNQMIKQTLFNCQTGNITVSVVSSNSGLMTITKAHRLMSVVTK